MILIGCWLLSVGCNNPAKEIEWDAIKQQLVYPNAHDLCHKQLFAYCAFNDTGLTLNNSMQYADAMQQLVLSIDSIENLSFNPNTRTYLKCLALANFTSTLFSGQFMGSKIGLSGHKISIPNWEVMSLRQQYDAGNNNQFPVWCGDRATFYRQLVDTLLGIQSNEVSIKGIHTFPLVPIGGQEYIFDPFDLLIPLDTIQKKVLDYESLKTKSFQSLVICDVKRQYGKCVELISDSFYSMLKDKYGKKDTSLCSMLNRYLQAEGDVILQQATICKPFVPLSYAIEIYPVQRHHSSYVITSNYKIGSTKHHLPNFFRQYFGDTCN